MKYFCLKFKKVNMQKRADMLLTDDFNHINLPIILKYLSFLFFGKCTADKSMFGKNNIAPVTTFDVSKTNVHFAYSNENNVFLRT